MQLDSKQDVSAKNLSFIISIIHRYVASDKLIKERLFTLLDVEKSTGEYYLQLLNDVLQSEKIGTSNCNCIGDATDSASNIQRSYKGFGALLKEQLPTHLHIWCYAHVLKLVVGDANLVTLDNQENHSCYYMMM